jgi:SAM-dependent methyltransferase
MTPVRTFTVEKCPGCGAERFRDVEVGGHHLQRCESCDLVSAPEMADPDEIYVDGYMTGGSELGFGLDVANPAFQALLLDCGHRRLREITKLVGRSEPLLDVGCGTGEFLFAAKQEGWKAVGVEPVTESADIAKARGLDIHCAMLQDAGLPERSFGLVTAFHVLEHMSDSVEFLKLISRWARPGGYVAIEVPNWDSTQRRRTGDAWPGLRPLEHIGHYSATTLRDTMARSGLEAVKTRTLTFTWKGTPAKYALNDLGLVRMLPRLRRLTTDDTRNGIADRYPSALLDSALRLVARGYDARRRGQVVLGVGRIPS